MPTKLHIGNLPDNCSDDTLRDLFSPYGDIIDLVVIKNFAFVNFQEDTDANNALRDLNGAKLLGKSISVGVSKSKGVKDKGDTRKRGPYDKTDFSRGRGPQDNWGDMRTNQRNDFNPKVEHFPPNLSGLLGNGPSMGDFGILSPVNTLAALTEKQRSLTQMNMNPLKDINLDTIQKSRSNVPQPSDNSGYVVYERYYIDPKHPLLKGLPLPELPSLSSIQDSGTRNNTIHMDSFSTQSDPFLQRDINDHRSFASSRDTEPSHGYVDNYRR